MPLKLKGILMDIGVRQPDFARAIVQRGGYVEGKPLSHSAAAALLAKNIWPSLTPREDIVRQTADFLRSYGVPQPEIDSAFEFDESDSHRFAHPKGVHTGQHTRAIPDIDPIETEMLTPTARKHFSLFRDPFTDDVQGPDDVFLSADQRYIREVLFSTAKHGGMVAIIGESGSGKTTLRRDMIDRIVRESLPIVAIQPQVIDKTMLTAGAICHAIIDDLQPSRKVPRTLEAQGRLVKTMLTESSRAGNSHVLLIEEAHDLNIQTLKYLKRFWELEDGFKKLLAIVLIGQPELKAMLNEGSTAGIQAREVIRRMEVAELLPLDVEVENYLKLKFKRIGVALEGVFESNAFEAIRARLTRPGKTPREAISMVYPLTTNRLVIRAMNTAADLGEPRVTADLIKEI